MRAGRTNVESIFSNFIQGTTFDFQTAYLNRRRE